jgi:hypothetical protein
MMRLRSIGIYCRGMLHRLPECRLYFFGATTFHHKIFRRGMSHRLPARPICFFAAASAFHQNLSSQRLPTLRAMFKNATAYHQEICWRYNPAADTTEIFVRSNGTFRDDLGIIIKSCYDQGIIYKSRRIYRHGQRRYKLLRNGAFLLY